jgi:hypothetical protein
MPGLLYQMREMPHIVPQGQGAGFAQLRQIHAAHGLAKDRRRVGDDPRRAVFSRRRWSKIAGLWRVSAHRVLDLCCKPHA